MSMIYDQYDFDNDSKNHYYKPVEDLTEKKNHMQQQQKRLMSRNKLKRY